MPELLQLDEEWVELIVQAKEIGLNVEEIREFLQANTNKKEII
ncbi:DNA-binding anti-repressor SinI [Peribacillus glennii]|uniref:DNA-binding anti-repressor SinI n=1 Tax=Peribacillus glennii TaxID=2303991 RepID=A0A372LDD7_9BACI|nr:DNA-binding anti-repressor SinI [Peribacillus glennii]